MSKAVSMFKVQVPHSNVRSRRSRVMVLSKARDSCVLAKLQILPVESMELIKLPIVVEKVAAIVPVLLDLEQRVKVFKFLFPD